VVTNAKPEWDDVAVERWIRGRYRALIDDLTSMLEVETGLRLAVVPAQHDRLVADLAAVLDLDAGLAAIGPVAGGAADNQESPPDERPQQVSTVRELIDALSLAAPAVRLSLRVPVRRLALGLALVGDLALARDRGRALAHALEQARGSRACTRDIHRVFDRARDLALAITRATNRARELAHALTDDPDSVTANNLIFALAGHCNRAEDLAHAGDRAYTEDLGALCYPAEFALTPDPDGALSRGSAFTRELDSDLNRTLRFVRGLVFDFGRDLAAAGVALLVDRSIGAQTIRSEELEQLIDTVRNFAGADLQEFDLTGIPLDGVRWSDSTRWHERWVKRIHDQSVAIGGGTYEIRPTTTTDFTPASR
jgi:hypothetical protein